MKQVIIPQKNEKKEPVQKKILESKVFYMFIAVVLIVIGILGYVTSQKNKIDEKVAMSQYEPRKVPPYEVPATVNEAIPPQPLDAEPVNTVDSENSKQAENSKFIKPVDAQVSIPFSKDNLIYSKTMEDWRTHLGIDIPGSIGTPVKAAANGVIEQVKSDEMLGNVVIIRHNDQLKTKYCNLQSDILVKAGDAVDTGTVIGGIGNTAASEIAEPPHLHFEVLSNGELVNPVDLFNK